MEYRRGRISRLARLKRGSRRWTPTRVGGEDRMAPDGLPDGMEQQVTGSAQDPADDHALGVDEVAQAGDRDADLQTRVGDGTAAADVALDRELDDAAEGQRFLVTLADELKDGGARRHRLEAASVTAVAKEAALVEGRVPDLAGRPGCSSQ